MKSQGYVVILLTSYWQPGGKFLSMSPAELNCCFLVCEEVCGDRRPQRYLYVDSELSQWLLYIPNLLL